MDDPEGQLMDIVACDRATAKRLLQQHGNDLQNTISAYFAGSGNTEDTTSQAVVPYIATEQSNGTGWTSPDTPIETRPQGPLTQENWAHLEGSMNEVAKKTERTSKKRNTPVDLTGDDEDDDLRKAMQASLESESTRQKRQQEYGYNPRSGARATNDDDIALTRAIEASMQQSTTATRAQSPQPFVKDFETLGALQMRPTDQPVIIVPPTPFMRLFATSLQALYAAKPFRQAFMSLKLSDLRLTLRGSPSMDNYWQGGSPSGIKGLTELDWDSMKLKATEEEKEALDSTMRLLTLFIFLTYTKRPICVAEDVISRPVKSNYAYVMNSSRRPASDIISCNIQATLEAVMLALDCLNNQIPGSREECKIQVRSACMTFTASAVTPQSEEPKQLRRPKEPYENSVIQLNYNNVNTSVHKALYSYLAEDKSLFTSTASTLLFSLGRLSTSSLPFNFGIDSGSVEEVTPFQVESKLNLDQFMFDKRNGVRLGLDSESVKAGLNKVESLEKHRKAIGWHQGGDSISLLRTSLQYFQELCSDKSADAMRTEHIKEAVLVLTKMIADLEQEIADTDEQIKIMKKAVEDERRTTMSTFLESLCDPSLQTIQYDLQAVMMNDDQTAWTYVRHQDMTHDQSLALSSSWWKICDGQIEQVTEADVLADGNTVHFLIYTLHESDAEMSVDKREEDTVQDTASIEQEDNEKANKTIRLDAILDWWTKTPLVECIEVDNAALGHAMARQLQEVQLQEGQDQEGRLQHSGDGNSLSISSDTVIPQYETNS